MKARGLKAAPPEPNIPDLIAAIAALKVEPSNKPRGAAREPWDVGYNDALAEVVEVIRRWAEGK